MSAYLDAIKEFAQLKKGNPTWGGINAEYAVRMDRQNRFKTGLEIAQYTADIMHKDMKDYDLDSSRYTQSLGCWHGFTAQQLAMSVKKHQGTMDKSYIYLSGWMVAALRSQFGPLPDQSMHEKTTVPSLIEEIYTFFRKHKIKHIQFSPVVESLPSKDEQSRGQHFASNLIFSTAKSYQQNKYNPLSWAVDAKEYGKFLVDIFNLWIKEDVGKVFILNFEQALTQYIGNPSPNCIHAKNCGSSYAVEANGDVYFCDHVAYPESKIGNVMTSSFQDIASNNKDIFNKESRLSERCKKCNVRQLCNGGCPKHRYLADTGEYENVLCDGYFHFFNSIQKYLHAMTQLLANGYPASYVMQALNGPLILKSSNN